MFSRKFNRHRGSAERLYAAPRKLAAPLLFLCLFLTGCSLRQMGVEAGLVDNPYYQEGDTEWDHGGIEEYYFNNLPSEYNEIYRELYSRLSAGEDSGDLYARTDADHFWKAYYSVLADHPELFWLDSSAEIQSNTFSGTVVRYSASTVVEPEKREEMRKALEEAADACIAGIQPVRAERPAGTRLGLRGLFESLSVYSAPDGVFLYLHYRHDRGRRGPCLEYRTD